MLSLKPRHVASEHAQANKRISRLFLPKLTELSKHKPTQDSPDVARELKYAQTLQTHSVSDPRPTQFYSRSTSQPCDTHQYLNYYYIHHHLCREDWKFGMGDSKCGTGPTIPDTDSPIPHVWREYHQWLRTKVGTTQWPHGTYSIHWKRSHTNFATAGVLLNLGIFRFGWLQEQTGVQHSLCIPSRTHSLPDECAINTYGYFQTPLTPSTKLDTTSITLLLSTD